MILVALAVVVLGTYVPFMLAAARGSRRSRILGALEGLLFTVGTGFAGLVAMAFLALKCDDTCDQDPEPFRTGDWWRTLDAWEWEAQAALALVAFLAALATLVLPLVRWYLAAIAAALLGLAAFCAWALLVAPLGEQFGI